MALATVAELEAWTGASVADATAAGTVLDLVSGTVAREARQTFELVTDDEVTLAGNWGTVLNLPERPVVSVSAVTIEGDTISDFTLLSHGRLRRGGLYSVGQSLPRNRGHWGGPEALVVVTYTHGFAVVPDGVKQIVCAAAARAIANPDSKTYLRIDDYAAGYSSAGPNPTLTGFEIEQLRSYRPVLQ